MHDSRAVEGFAPAPNVSEVSPPFAGRDSRRRQVLAAETRLLYDNICTSIAIAVVIAALLAYAQWDLRPRSFVVAWFTYMLLVAGGRFVVAKRYHGSSAPDVENSYWTLAFVVGGALAGVGWGMSAIMLAPSGQLVSEMLVVFAVGGVMLGGASTLAARPEAFLTFLLPAGLVTTLRLASVGDQYHLIMGFLGALFTAVTVVTTWRFHHQIASSFKLRFENQDLIESLQTANNDAEALNRELELRVHDRTVKLQEADQRKDEFLATLAHELRNPLAPIRFALQALKADVPGFTTARAHDVIDRQITQLVRLVDDLLDVSRITANKIQLRREAVDLAHVMSAAVESIAPLAAAAGHRLEVRLPPTPILVNADSARLIQVFANVLHNAVKFTPRGGYIAVSARVHADQVAVDIRDSGIGIAPDMISRVFEIFQQAQPALERSTGGLGIGLTLARRLVDMHDGAIAISSPGTGQGTHAEIRLPISNAARASVVPLERPIAASSPVLRVLIVEDNVDAAEMLELAVEQLGHVTQMVHDGAIAIATATQFAPDVILLDIGLPTINGYEVARRLREIPECRHVHIAAVTGWGQEEDRRKARDAGCDSHFTKPLVPTMLADLLARIAQGIPERQRATSTPRTRFTDSGSAF